MFPAGETVHASAVLIGERAVLIRGPSGSGKSTLAFSLLDAAKSGILPYARLVADDRVKLFSAHGRLLAAVPEAIFSMIEARGLGIRRIDCEPLAMIGLIVDLAADDGARIPEANACETEILGVKVPRLPVKKGEAAFPLLLAALTTTEKR
jgi:HPr kinase/phosphorylase